MFHIYKQLPKREPITRRALTFQASTEFVSELDEFSKAIGTNRHALMHLAMRRGIESLKRELAITPESDQAQR